MSQNEDEWEYEYDQEATETFLLDLDLTSLNHHLKSNVPGRRPLDRSFQVGDENARSRDAQHEATPIDDDLDATPSTNSNRLDNALGPASNSLQILELHSHNPIVSYRNDVYSCTWADMIGTNMFFVSPINPWPDSEEPLELVGMSRVRLLGHVAKVVAKQGNAADATISNKKIFEGTSMMPQHKNANTVMKRQADFLERLMEAKKAKGEMDVVRALVPGSSKKFTSGSASLNEESSARREEWAQLNKRVVRGDSRALTKLQKMYGHESGPAHQDARNEELLDEDVIESPSAPPQTNDNH